MSAAQNENLLLVGFQSIFSTIITISPFIIPCIICYFLAKRKGYSKAFFLFGILSIFGIIIVAVLPKRNEEASLFRQRNKL